MAKVLLIEGASNSSLFFDLGHPSRLSPSCGELCRRALAQVPRAKGAHGMNSHELAVLVKGQCHISRAQLYGRRGAIRPLI
jgi:hypothetical protein